MRKLLTLARKNAVMALVIIAVAALAALNILLPEKDARPDAAAATQPAATPDPAALTRDADKLRISELMAKNHATLRADDGSFPDWIELENYSDTDVNLSGWSVSDGDGETGFPLPALTLRAGERLLLYADGGDDSAALHTDFSLSAGETACLYNSAGYQVCAVDCGDGTADVSVSLGENGQYAPCLYPTPGYPNTAEGYGEWQSALSLAGPLVINEVMTANFSSAYAEGLGYCDWVEIKNVSGESVELSDYCLSDDDEDYRLWRFPERTLAPGETLPVFCDDSSAEAAGGAVRADFALNSGSEELYLSRADGELIDYAALRDIPYECSFGRAEGENGWFFFASPTPGAENGEGCRRVSAKPAALSADGVFDAGAAIDVELTGDGAIYYTTDGSLPTENSELYSGALSVDSSCVVRAVCVEPGALPSRALSLSYIVGEGHSLPVLSLVSDDLADFNSMYAGGYKDMELPGNLALYEDGASFTIPCGVKMQGETSLILAKKNMSVRFRGAYGQETLERDLFGGGVTEFTNLVLRAGQDYYSAIIRNELCENLCLASTDRVAAQRSKYCVLYINGEYSGVYALAEKVNEQLYASNAGVSRESVTLVESEAQPGTELYEDVFVFCYQNDMSLPENYEHFCALMDVDSLIDWIIMEGYCANGDLDYGNLRYCRSTENDGKWRLMFYDLDSTFFQEGLNFYNLLSAYSRQTKQVSTLISALLENGEFTDRLLTRAGELLNSSLTNEKVAAEIDALAAEIEPEVERDYARYGMSFDGWKWNVGYLRDFITAGDWRQHNIDALAEIFDLTAEQRARYFG